MGENEYSLEVMVFEEALAVSAMPSCHIRAASCRNWKTKKLTLFLHIRGPFRIPFF